MQPAATAGWECPSNQAGARGWLVAGGYHPSIITAVFNLVIYFHVGSRDMYIVIVVKSVKKYALYFLAISRIREPTRRKEIKEETSIKFRST
jgi:hypothetical protein